VQWKRKAEQYLIASGLNYTIIHPGGETLALPRVVDLPWSVNTEVLDIVVQYFSRAKAADGAAPDNAFLSTCIAVLCARLVGGRPGIRLRLCHTHTNTSC